MNKVYVVTAGCYSDYHIVAVFSTKEKAEEYIAYHGTDYRFEGYGLDKEFERKESLWCVVIDLSDHYETRTYSVLEDDDEDDEGRLANTCQKDQFSKDIIRFYVYADTSEMAIKIAYEHLGAIKANDYVWQKLNTVIEERKHEHGHFWTDRKVPIYNFHEERFVDLD